MLIRDPRDLERRRERTREQVVEMTRRNLARRIRDRIAVGILRWPAEQLEHVVSDRLIELHRNAPSEGKSSQTGVVLASELKWKSPYGFKRNEFVFPALEAINKAAYWDYQRERVYVKSRFKTKFRPARRTKRATSSYVAPSGSEIDCVSAYHRVARMSSSS